MYLDLLRRCASGFALLVAAAAAGGCGHTGVRPTPDGGQANFRLTVLDPPGESIGLPYGGQVTLRVRYDDDHGDALSGAKVAFSTTSSGTESTGGATLSADSATTGPDGVASIDLVSGAEQVNFRVAATAANAPPAYFYIAVSEGGFTDLTVTPVHHGVRPISDFRLIEVRLYPAADVDCATFDVDSPPASVFPPRELDQFGGSVTYHNVSAGEGYTLIGWALPNGGKTRVAAGCVDLGAAQVLPGRAESLLLPLADRPAALPRSIPLTSRFDLAPLGAAITSAGADAPWQTLACPAGPGQLLLDCTLDAAADNGPLDCILSGSHPLADAVAASRGTPDSEGCRPATLSGGGASLDGELAAAVAAGGTFPTGTDLDALLSARRDTLTSAELDSTLTPMGGSALHTLDTLRITVAGKSFATDLGATARPVIAQEAAIARDGPIGDDLEIGPHAFTLRYGTAALAAFRAGGLAPVGLDGQADALGAALAGSARDAQSGDTGCAAVSRIICTAAGQAADCAQTACASAAAALDTSFLAWGRFADGAGPDFQLQGSAPIYDFNDDLAAESIGRAADGSITGTWTATLTTQSGQAVQLSGAFGSPTTP